MTPLSRVTDHLWIGSFEALNDIPAGFDQMLITARSYEINSPVNVPPLHHVPLHDNGRPLPDEEATRAVQAGRAVAGWMTRKQRVLITCRMGWNRSGLVGAIALMTNGMKPAEAIKCVRAARGDNALSNPHFVRFLERLYDASELRFVV